MRVQTFAFVLFLALGGRAQDNTDRGYRRLDSTTLCSTDSNGLESCYPRVFNAATEFQPIKPGQEVPAGLHVQIDMGTGQRQARLIPLADTDAPKSVEVEGANVSTGQEVFAVMPSHKDRTQELIDFIVSVGSLAVDRSADEQLVEMLDELKEISYDPRQAERLMRTPGAISALLQLSNPTHTPFAWSATARRLSSITMGTMVQNSPELQGMAFRAGAIPNLVHALRDERDAKTAGKHVFALSALTRGHALALEQFAHLGGLRILRSLNPLASSVYRGEADVANLDLRIVRFVEDVLNPDFNPHIPATSASVIAQFASVWCSTLANRLVDSLEDVVSDKSTGPVYERRLVYMRSLKLIQHAHRDTCVLPADFKRWTNAELTRIGRIDSSGMDDYRQALNGMFSE
ncbi:nucleotide exchange factor sil1 [Coemansia sp. RSA 1822]|nr:nucleotide exchange factor sil1 [Coemansia sp. RSA 638]KAJ2125742.1 nucleotide exchange factor sil1 [Coemansia sp. RSA 720]KAJ2541220.1 nucleotide exchange factor sil1 [Coemansia sp. RSA 1853]KAJ2561298.1 nucleotide exchange factor sil1 [Coemansia sp. RSA 1822]